MSLPSTATNYNKFSLTAFFQINLLPKQQTHILKQTLRIMTVVELKYLKEKNVIQSYPVCWRCTSYAAFQSECQALI